MSTDLLFTPPAPQNPSNGFQPNNKIGSAGSVRTGKTGTNRNASSGEPDPFLRTLNKVSREQQDCRREVNAGDERSVKKPVVGRKDQTDDGHFPRPASIDPNLPVTRETDPLRMEPDLDLTAYFNILSELGIDTGAAETGFDTAADLTIADPKRIAAIENWIARLQQTPAALTADLKTVVERIQQMIAEALNGKRAIGPDGKAGQGIDTAMVTEAAGGDRFLKEISAAAMDRNAARGWNNGITPSNANVPEMTTTSDKGETETAAKPSVIKITSSNPESRQSAADPSGSLKTSSKGHGSEDTARTAGMNHPSGSESRSVFGRANSNDTVAADSAKAGNSPFITSPQSVRGPQNENDGLTGRTVLPAENSSGADPGQPSPRATAASDLNPALNRASDVRLHSTAGEEPVSRLFQETRLTGEGVNRMGVDLTDEPTGKAVKSQTATGDNGLLNSSGQNAEKMVEGAAPVKDADAGQGVSRNQALDQIVRRAAIHLRNGQQEARIDLKPDFLGHVRLQIISENHQVTVKILAEHGFVKDMIENNLHQLKADLQQQGLEVDKVEVSVSQDSEEGANSREKLAQSKIKQGAANHRNEHHAADEDEQESRPKSSSSESSATIDYFA